MTSTVRSVRVVMDADVGAYVAKMKAAGKATDDAFDGIERRLDGASSSLGGVEKAAAGVEKSTTAARPAVKGLGDDVDGLGKRAASTAGLVSRLSATLDKQTGAVTGNTRAVVAKRLADDGALLTAQALGVSLRDVTDAASGDDQALSRLLATTRDLDGDTTGLVQSVARTSAALGDAQSRARLLGEALGDVDAEPVARDIDKVSSSSAKAGPEIDRFSGRLGVLRDLGITIGPALIPLAAGTLPALTAGVFGLGSGLIGLGVGVAALHGVGDGLKALDAYQLDPTIENFRKLQQAEQSLGPAGTQFLHYLDSLEPKLKDLQNVARAGFLPGLEDGIDSLITRLPVVRDIVESVSTELGTLSRDAGSALASDDFTPFFDYLRTDAAPTLDAFARSAGNVGLGLANLLVAFAPATRDFTGGLVDLTSRFADFSKTLDTNTGFQNFLTYVRESGPQVVALLGGVAQAVGGLAQAAAPIGQVVLPALTNLLDLFGKIAGSPIGPPLYAAAAGMIAFSRATKAADSIQGRFNLTSAGLRANAGKIAAGIGLIAVSSTDYTKKLGLANTASYALAGGLAGGPVGAALLGGVGLYKDLSASTDDYTAAIRRADDALGSGSFDDLKSALTDINAQLDHLKSDTHSDNSGLSKVLGVSQLKADFARLTGVEDDLKTKQADLNDSLRESGGVAELFGESIGQTGDQMKVAAGDAQALTGALSALNGFFDKRDAVRSYKDSIDALSKGLKDGFTREDAGNIDAVGRGILQVADQIKNPGKQASFLTNARQQLVDLADHAGPRASAAIQGVIDKFDDKGLTHPPAITLSADDRRAQAAISSTKAGVAGLSREKAFPVFGANASPFKATYGTVKQQLAAADAARANPTITANAGQAIAAIHSVLSLLAGVHNVSSTITTTHVVRNVGPTGNPQARADGGEIFGQRHPYGDKVLIAAAPGEHVISNRFGQADRFRADSAAGRIPGYADGGTVKDQAKSEKAGGPTRPRSVFISDSVEQALADNTKAQNKGSSSLIKGLKTLEHSLDRSVKAQQDAVDRAQKRDDRAHADLDAVASRYDALASTIGGTLGLDSVFNKSDDVAASANPFAQGAHGAVAGTRDPNAALDQVTATSAQFVTDIKTLQSDGIFGAALQAIISQGPDATHDLASSSASYQADYQTKYTAAAAGVAAVSGYGAGAVEGEARAAAQANADRADKQLGKIEDRLKGLQQTFRDVGRSITEAEDAAAEKIKNGVNGAGAQGQRNRVYAGSH